MVCEEKMIVVENFIDLNSFQGVGKIFDLIDIDFIGIKKNFVWRNLIHGMKILNDCCSDYSYLFGDDNFGKKVIYDFLLLGTYVGDFGNECVWIIEYFD